MDDTELILSFKSHYRLWPLISFHYYHFIDLLYSWFYFITTNFINTVITPLSYFIATVFSSINLNIHTHISLITACKQSLAPCRARDTDTPWHGTAMASPSRERETTCSKKVPAGNVKRWASCQRFRALLNILTKVGRDMKERLGSAFSLIFFWFSSCFEQWRAAGVTSGEGGVTWRPPCVITCCTSSCCDTCLHREDDSRYSGRTAVTLRSSKR